MSITMNCPRCERKNKIKIELIGRRVKCSGCKEGFEVPEKLAESIAPAPENAAQAESKDGPKDEKPYKKAKRRKKKKYSKRARIIIGSAVGCLALLVIAVLLVIFANNETAKEGPSSSEPETASQRKKESRAEGTGRAVPVDQAQTDLTQIARALKSWYDGQERGPKDYLELSKNFENKAHFEKAFATNQITVIWNVPKAKYSSEFIPVIAYETLPDRNGIRFVLRNYGFVEELDEMEFQAAPKSKTE